MIQATILGTALALSLVAIVHLIVNLAAAMATALNGSKKWTVNAIPTLLIGTLAIVFWSIFYYLTY